ncbi:DUF1439 domain-containing protein [Microbulbifer flavimaris]|uniref:DUF1439 domain-containing protein n=1 Tax=Microbulbifer flavimaris TaxID=1781068 RepID=A0ABX4I1S3_9GAMM|nr:MULTISPECIES: DUF1439 domain-containing protein [Microbulbifer]KUJ84279.1 hypothetical protein AVO43_00800 [Microbulbifer sp. ZGT114]PCO06359.1 DUF1439 domain-containing protein [Microbulbifer flavimaris]
MKAFLATLCIALLLLAVVGYLFYSNREHQLRIPEEQLQQRLQQRMPQTRTYLRVFDVTLDNPRVQLREESGRIGAGMDILVELRSTGKRREYRGKLDVAGLVRYDASSGRFYLSEAEIEQLELGSLEGKTLERVRAVLQLALQEYFALQPLYELKPGDIRQRAARMVLRRVEVQGDELVITLSL